jgi:hypothetical protein
MKISELVEVLNKLKDEHGDVEVYSKAEMRLTGTLKEVQEGLRLDWARWLEFMTRKHTRRISIEDMIGPPIVEAEKPTTPTSGST